MNRLKIIREKKTLTLAQLSARTSIPVRLLGEYEENLEEIPPAHLKALAKALWVKPDELLVANAPSAPSSASVAPMRSEPAIAAALPPLAPAPNPLPPTAAPPMGAAPYERPAPPPMPPPATNGGPPLGSAPRPSYAAPPPRRPAGPGGPGGDMGRGGRPMAGGRPKREPVNMPATEGQLTEIMRLAARLNLSTNQLETQFGRPLNDITRFDAREWIKNLREEAAAKAPPSKIHFGQWPGLKDDLEAVYLTEQKEAAAPFRFALFNGEVLSGRITDFTPYTITIAEDGGDTHVVVRKLAIAYYRRLGKSEGAAPPDESETKPEAEDRAPFPGPAQPPFNAPPAMETDTPDAGGAG